MKLWQGLVLAVALGTSLALAGKDRPASVPGAAGHPANPVQAGASGIPTVALKRLGSIDLVGKLPKTGTSPIRDIGQFAIDDRGRFGFLTDCIVCEQAFVLVDRNGALVRSMPFPSALEAMKNRQVAWIKGNRWLLVTSEYSSDAKASAVWIDAATGTVTPVSAMDAPPIDSVAGTGDGGLVAISRSETAPFFGPHTRANSLSAFDRNGRKRWTIGQDAKDASKLTNPNDVVVTTDHQVAVLESSENALKVYTLDGRRVRTVDLTKAWGRKPGFLSDMHADDAGGVYVNDGIERVVRMSLEGKPLATLVPVYPGGPRFYAHGGVEVGPDGAIWTNDHIAFMRLSKSGAVDRQVGRKFDLDQLGQIAALDVSTEGRIYAADERTFAVHVFDDNGRRVRVNRPKANDYDGMISSRWISASDQGDVFVSRQDGSPQGPDAIHYAPNGKRTGIESDRLEKDHASTWIAQPGSSNRWVRSFLAFYLVDAKGKVLRKVDHTADGRGLAEVYAADAAPDGSIAVESEAIGKTLGFTTGGQTVVTTISQSGIPIATWPAPHAVEPSYDSIAFDGTQLAFLVMENIFSDQLVVVVTDQHGTPRFRYVPPTSTDRPHLSSEKVFLVRRGAASELWLFDGESTIDRYAMQ